MDRPIIFSGSMVRALLDGRKTQTRRLAWRDMGIWDRPSPWQKAKADDRLWVRENFCAVGKRGNLSGYDIYRADEAGALGAHGAVKWTPSIHMPRVASRLTLVVTAVKIERLTEISEADALAEGVVRVGRRWEVPGLVATPISAVDAFSSLWQYINGEDSWDRALEVVALTFTVHKANIDALAVAA